MYEVYFDLVSPQVLTLSCEEQRSSGKGNVEYRRGGGIRHIAARLP
jgi:hypothetical protein